MFSTESFVINPNIIISSYCYSILRFEPYTSCDHSCLYCYRRWVAKNFNKEISNHLKIFRKIYKKINYPIRASTLTDPFGKLEERYKIMLKFLKLCKERNLPLIINTKSDLISKEPWINHLYDNVIIQFSVSTLYHCNKFEPYAPDVFKRFDAMEKLSENGYNVILRYQPLIPNIVEDEYKEILEEAKGSGVKQIIVESIRLKVNDQFLTYIRGIKFEKYFESDYLITPEKTYREKVIKMVYNYSKKLGLEFSTCKEGFFELHTAKNCCGFHHLNSYKIRLTLKEIYDAIKNKGYIHINDVNKILDERFIERNPELIHKKIFKLFMKHYRKLLKVIESNTVSEISPLYFDEKTKKIMIKTF